jgi:WD40 repeat protein
VQTPALVSAVRFNTEGDLAVAGLVNGHAVFYQLAGGLRYYTQIECRGSKGSRKVTSLRFFRVPGSRKEMLVLTSNDSRVRLYSMDDFSLVCKYRGAANGARLQIGATCSHDGRHIVCGSEDRSVVLWRARNDLVKTIFGRQGRRDMCDTFESFHATANGPVTAACFAPPQVAQAARRPLSVFSSMASVSDLLADAAKEGRNTRQSSLTWAAVQHTEKSLASEGEPDDAGLPGAILVTCGMDGAVAVFENAAL